MKVGEFHLANTNNLGLPGVNIDHECKLWWHWQQPDKKSIIIVRPYGKTQRITEALVFHH